MKRLFSLVLATVIAVLFGGWLRPGAPHPVTGPVFYQGALHGGGYVTDISISNDGSGYTTKVVSTDVYGAYALNSQIGTTWTQLASATALPAPYNTTALRSPGSIDIVVAPNDHNRIYWLVATNTGSTLGAHIAAQLMRSDDGGQTFSLMQSNIAAGGAWWRYNGRKLAVDPANENIVYFSNAAGVIFLSTDGGTHFAEVTALSSHLISATGCTSVAGNPTISCLAVPSAVTTLASAVCGAANCWSNYTFQNIAVYDQTNPTASPFPQGLSGATSTTMTVGGEFYPYFNSGATIASGDNLILGGTPSIVFDPSSGTTSSCPTVGGVTPGTCTLGIYIGWSAGSDGIYHSTNAGSSWAKLTSGGPTHTIRMKVASNGALYVVSYDHYSGYDNINPWSAYGYNIPGNPGAWTLFNIVTGNYTTSVAVDPQNAGHVCFAAVTATFFCATDYGTSNTWVSSGPTNPTDASHGFQYVVPSGEPTWLSNTNYFGSPGYQGSPFAISNMEFDTDTGSAGHLWFADGKGIYWTPPNYSASATQTIHIASLNNAELLPQDMDKPSGHALVGLFQDYGIFYIPDVTQEPTQNQPVSIGQSGVAIFEMSLLAHALDTPSTRLAAYNSNIYKSTDDGQTWAPTAASPSTAGPLPFSGGALAASTNSNYIYAPTALTAAADQAKSTASTIAGTTLTLGGTISHPYIGFETVGMLLVGAGITPGTYTTGLLSGTANAPGSTYGLSQSSTISTPQEIDANSPPIIYTDDGGSSWHGAAFGSPGGMLSIGGGYLNNPRNVVADKVTAGTYYAASNQCLYGQTCVAGTDYGQFWKSVDYGHNWTLTAAGKGGVGSLPAGWPFQAGNYTRLETVPGNAGHLFYATGLAGGNTLNTGALIRSCDGGSTWVQVNFYAVEVAAGIAKPGNSYPAIYVWGSPTGSFPFGFYRSDDATAACNTTLTWTHLTDAPYGNIDYITNIIADQDTYGTFYFGTAGGGYGWSKLQ